MNARQRLPQVIGLVIIICLLAGCGSTPAAPAAAPEPTAAPTASEEGYITGRVHLAGPPTPRMFVYAVDQATGKWATTETQPTDSEAAFTLVVPPGTYQVFAFTDNNGYAVYSLDGWNLAVINVAANQTVAEINVGPPSQSECGSMIGVPAAPDGRFAAVAGPDEACKASLLAAASASTQMYEPVSQSVCQVIQELATQTLSVNFTMEANAPFNDMVSGESGQGCRLIASGNGNNFSSPGDVITTLIQGVGFTEQPAYRADGPTGAASAATRDMALMLIQANWVPSADAQCQSDQPIANCNLTPEQKLYTIQIDVAQYKATFSLDGHWEDAATGLSLDLYQDWKTIYGHHLIVAQNGNKIDSLDVSINGMLQGQVATVQFQSSFTSDVGTAQITYIDVNTITWKIIDPPDGEYYLPAEASLTRK